MIRRFLVIACAGLSVFPAGDAGAQDASRAVRLGIVMDGPSERYRDFRDLLQNKIVDLLSREFVPTFPPGKLIVADWTSSSVSAALVQLLEDDDVDMVLALGVLASQHAAELDSLEKPVVAPFVLDTDLQSLPREEGASGVANLDYVILPSPFARDIDAFRELLPFRRLAVLMNRPYADALPDFTTRVREAVTAVGAEATLIPVDRSVTAALDGLPPDADAVYVFPLLQLTSADIEQLADGLIDRGLPSFSFLGEAEVERGLLATLNTEAQWTRLARRTALNVQRLILGEAAGDIPVAFSGSPPMLAINPLQTESQISEQRGFLNLVKGVFGMFRNPTAHEARINWNMVHADAEDLL